MGSLSIHRRRKAWLDGVVCGATGKGKCLLQTPKLKDIFQRGFLHGQLNANSNLVKAAVEQAQRKQRPVAKPRPERRFGRAGGQRGPRRPEGHGGGQFGRPGGFGRDFDRGPSNRGPWGR